MLLSQGIGAMEPRNAVMLAPQRAFSLSSTDCGNATFWLGDNFPNWAGMVVSRTPETDAHARASCPTGGLLCRIAFRMPRPIWEVLSAGK